MYEAEDLSVFQADRFAPASKQRVYDAAARLRIERSRVADAILAGAAVDARIIGRGGPDINRWMLTESHRWHHLLSARPEGQFARARVSLPNNQSVTDKGLTMVSLWDYEACEYETRLLLACQDPQIYYFAFVPAQLKIVDHREVLLDGPVVREQPTVMRVRDAGCMEAAREYWRTVMATAYPCAAEKAGVSNLSPRQQRIVGLMMLPFTDDQIATRIGVSVRTVRYDIAAILDELEAPNRFVAGLRLREQYPTEVTGQSPDSGHGSEPQP